MDSIAQKEKRTLLARRLRSNWRQTHTKCGFVPTVGRFPRLAQGRVLTVRTNIVFQKRQRALESAPFTESAGLSSPICRTWLSFESLTSPIRVRAHYCIFGKFRYRNFLRYRREIKEILRIKPPPTLLFFAELAPLLYANLRRLQRTSGWLRTRVLQWLESCIHVCQTA